ncbi:RagB/SusD family nutrient uptake outer membrane protein [Parapedobacter tibetensis]|uniref:RagB/SusD family nutrient uptake outer membrane protein n=1 Tax=Parapedobacter tibetensis TaxID=2972951 RepID=UPI00214D5DFA|nr:RagB/SusD family nutrient uptake outer membrane protein [Parapedobacter tibetensis]
MKKLMWIGFIALAGCTDFFEVTPYNAVKEDEFYKNREDLNAAAIGMYQSLTKEVHKFLLWGDARADMVTTGQPEPDPYVNEFVLNNVTVNNPHTDYSGIYRTIARCNRQLERVYDVMAVDDKILDRDAGAFYGEALLLRAYCYYLLVRTFDRFPIIRSDYAEEIRFVNEQGDTVSRATAALTVHEIRGLYQFPEDKQEVWLMIYNDVLTVLGILPLNYQWDRNSLPAQQRYGRMSQATANTFATELALWLGEYQSASAFANSPITNNNHGLGTSGNWINQFTGSYASQHSMFLLGYQYEKSFETNRLQEFTSQVPADGGRYHLKPVSHVINTIFFQEEGDIRTSFSYKVIGQDTVIWKYIGTDNVLSMRPPYQSNASWQLYRSADAYLFKALADLMLNDYSSAFNFLNMVREARGLLPLLPEEIDYTNKPFMLAQLFNERAREFAFEGKRWYDLMLWSELSGENKLAPHVAAKYPPGTHERVEEKLRFEQNWFIPVDPLLWK